MNSFARRHRRFFSTAILLAVLLQGFVVASAASPISGSHAAAHCEDMDKSAQDDCCSCCPEGTVMTSGCLSVCIVQCSNDAAALALEVSNHSEPVSHIGKPFANEAQIPPTPPPISR